MGWDQVIHVTIALQSTSEFNQLKYLKEFLKLFLKFHRTRVTLSTHRWDVHGVKGALRK